MSPTDWQGVALTKLTRILGESAGRELASSVMKDLGLQALSSAADLRRFAQALSKQGGFAHAVGALLELHATMYGDDQH